MENETSIKVTWLKCHHGRELRDGCPLCEQEKRQYKDNLFKYVKSETPKKIPIKRGCPNKGGACFCTGICQEIVGYRDPFPGETL